MDFTKAINAFIDRQTTKSLRLILGSGVACIALIIAIILLSQIRPIAETRLESLFENAGFKNVQIGDVSLLPSGLRASNIKLDKDGFDTIKTLSADFSWPSFLTSGKIGNLEIKDVMLSRTADSFASSGRQLASALLDLPDYRISISNVTLDLDTGFGAIRLIIDATAEPSNKDQSHGIQAGIKADQYQLGFTSSWQGKLEKGGTLDLAGNVLDGRLNLGPLRISRFNGWVGAGINGKGYTVQSQLEAGSASFMNVPLQNISLVNDSNAEKDDVIVRSGISGIPDILFTADLSSNASEQNFTAALKGENLAGFLDYVDEAKKTGKHIGEPLLVLREFELTARFQPEKRFVGGPMPFGVTLLAGNQKLLDGNVLFYPDTFDVRGSLETKPDMAHALQDYFRIPSSNIVQNFIRLDGDARKFFGFDSAGEKTAKAP